jgi:hypothetical protein
MRVFGPESNCSGLIVMFENRDKTDHYLHSLSLTHRDRKTIASLRGSSLGLALTKSWAHDNSSFCPRCHRADESVQHFWLQCQANELTRFKLRCQFDWMSREDNKSSEEQLQRILQTVKYHEIASALRQLLWERGQALLTK